MEDRERREELTEEEQTEADRKEPIPTRVGTDPESAPQEGHKRIVAPDEEEVAEAEEEGKGPHPRDQEDTQQG